MAEKPAVVQMRFAPVCHRLHPSACLSPSSANLRHGRFTSALIWLGVHRIDCSYEYGTLAYVCAYTAPRPYPQYSTSHRPRRASHPAPRPPRSPPAVLALPARTPSPSSPSCLCLSTALALVVSVAASRARSTRRPIPLVPTPQTRCARPTVARRVHPHLPGVALLVQ